MPVGVPELVADQLQPFALTPRFPYPTYELLRDEFRGRLIEEIERWERTSPPGTPYSYYDCWATALERFTRATTHQGFHVIHATHAGMAYWVVSDLNAEELASFARMFAAPPAKPS